MYTEFTHVINNNIIAKYISGKLIVAALVQYLYFMQLCDNNNNVKYIRVVQVKLKLI